MHNPSLGQTAKNNKWTVIGASSAGTLIEWYNFYIFGSLATIISHNYNGGMLNCGHKR